MNPSAGDAEVRSSSLSLAGFWPRCAALLSVVAAALLLVGLVAWWRGGPDALTAAALSAMACGLCTAAALACAAIFRSPDMALLQMLAGMFLRMGVPLVLVLVVNHFGGRLADAGMVYYLLTFYLITLAAEIPLSLTLPQGQGNDGSPRSA